MGKTNDFIADYRPPFAKRLLKAVGIVFCIALVLCCGVWFYLMHESGACKNTRLAAEEALSGSTSIAQFSVIGCTTSFFEGTSTPSASVSLKAGSNASTAVSVINDLYEQLGKYDAANPQNEDTLWLDVSVSWESQKTPFTFVARIFERKVFPSCLDAFLAVDQYAGKPGIAKVATTCESNELHDPDDPWSSLQNVVTIEHKEGSKFPHLLSADRDDIPSPLSIREVQNFGSYQVSVAVEEDFTPPEFPYEEFLTTTIPAGWQNIDISTGKPAPVRVRIFPARDDSGQIRPHIEIDHLNGPDEEIDEAVARSIEAFLNVHPAFSIHSICGDAFRPWNKGIYESCL